MNEEIKILQCGLFNFSGKLNVGKWYILRSAEYLHPDLVWRKTMLREGRFPELGEETVDDFVYSGTEQEAKDRVTAYLTKHGKNP